MRKKKGFFQINILSLFFLCICFLPSLLFGQDFDNIGFRRDVPEEVIKACSVCDEFLDVKWIDEDRYIGKLKTEWYKDGQKQGILYLLVKLEEPGSEEMFRRGNFIIYNITEEEYQNKNFENFIKQAKYTYGKGYFFMFAKEREIKREFYQGNIPSEFYLESYANFSRTICVPYPHKEYIFIVETKKPFIKENLNQILRKKYDQIIEYISKKCLPTKKCIIDQIKYTDEIDVNFDKLDDYNLDFG